LHFRSSDAVDADLLSKNGMRPPFARRGKSHLQVFGLNFLYGKRPSVLKPRLASWFIGVLALVLSLQLAQAQTVNTAPGARALITQVVDRNQLVTLVGNTRPEANANNDRGPVAGDFPLDHLQLQLRLPPEKEQELERLIDELHDPSSPNFHKWLRPDQFREQFSLAPEDLDAITAWLQSQSFTVNVTYPRSIDFSGTAGQVQNAFQTEIHNLDVNGESHIANMTDPNIPAALAPAVLGVVSLNDFRPHPLNHQRANFTVAGGYYFVVPADLATIYNFNPLFAAGYSGQGQTIVVIEDSDVFNYPGDWNTFRSTLGLTAAFPGATFTQIHPAGTGTNTCTDPGVNGDDDEAAIDVEWATAAAPSAAIELASCADTATNFGGFIALQNLLNAGTPPAIISVSYGDSEPFMGAAYNSSVSSLYQQAVSEGVSVFVSSGDAGAAGSDQNASFASHGIAVSGFTSTPYNVSVGGTDFGDTYASNTGAYWNSINTSTYGSAKSYVPEIPWNDSCASVLIATYVFGPSETTYGSNGFCNSSTASSNNLLTTVAGSGGPSRCATGVPATPGVVGGTCAGYAKPNWQSVFGNPSDKLRDIPDISLFAANGVWGHYYVVCWSDTARGGNACTGTPDTWAGFGGTSISSPIMAAIQALVNQKTGERQGNPNPVYYKLAAQEYGASGNSSCNSNPLGSAPASTCTFYDVTLGDMDVNCRGTINCYLPSGKYGVLSTSGSAYQLAYGTGSGWDFATGIGSVNAANLVNNWPGASPPTVFIDAPAPGAMVSGIVAITGWAVDNASAVGTAISSVQVKVDGTAVGTAAYGLSRSDVCAVYPGRPGCPNVGYSFSLNTSTLSVGAHTITVTATDSDTISDTGSFSVTVNVQAPPPTVYIDAPTPGATVSGIVSITGWAVDNAAAVGSAISSVQVKVDGTVVGTATYGLSRPDVCAVYPGRPGCPNVGYSFSLNTSTLSTGTHTLTATATDSDATPDSASSSVTVNVQAPPPAVWIDAPTSGATISGIVAISGWAVDNAVAVGTAISSVQVKVDGTVVGTATYGLSRPDVCAAFPGRPGCPNVGYSYSLNTSTLSPGSHTITVTATDSDGTPDSGSSSVTLTVQTTPPTVWIDAPTQGSTVSGTVTVVGWAIDNTSAVGTAISGVQVKVDGLVVGTATYGLSRPDVCAVYPNRPSCPNVGYSFSLNTSALSAGAHTITVTATDSDGTPDTGSASVSVTK
jgi:hypothetical protein